MNIGIDVHCHLEHMPSSDSENILEEAKKKMLAVISNTAEIKHAQYPIDLHKKHPTFVYAALGLHPTHSVEYSQKEIDGYIELIKANRKNIVALGEIGLDYHWLKKKDDREKSINIFEQFLELAKELRLPVIIHSRNSVEHQDAEAITTALKILANMNIKNVVMHCFSGSESDMLFAVEQGYFISVATVICKSKKHQRLAAKLPLENMLLETDAPWLDPYSRELNNRPWKIFESSKLISSIKNVEEQEILKQTTENAISVFKLPISAK